MFDNGFRSQTFIAAEIEVFNQSARIGGSTLFWRLKRVFDIAFSLIMLPALLVFAGLLVLANPFWNKGPLLISQRRMGKDCRPFMAWKFRSMVPVSMILRGPHDPIEHDRITPLGALLRKSRIDELPQILNVLKGDMSLIGPRPDYFAHAETYAEIIPFYRERHSIRPGISGLAQVEIGYVADTDGVRAKTLADLQYIRNAGFGLDTRIFFRTIRTVLARAGA